MTVNWRGLHEDKNGLMCHVIIIVFERLLKHCKDFMHVKDGES